MMQKGNIVILYRKTVPEWLCNLADVNENLNIKFVSLYSMMEAPEKVLENTRVIWLYHSLESYRDGLPVFYDSLLKLHDLASSAKIPIINKIAGIFNIAKSVLLQSAQGNGFLAPGCIYEPAKFADCARLGIPFILRDDISHLGQNMYLVDNEADYIRIRPHIRPCVAIQFVETADCYGYRQRYRYIVAGERAVYRNAPVGKNFKVHCREREFTPEAREFEELAAQETLHAADECARLVSTLGLDIAAVDFLLPEGFGGRPVFIDVTTTFCLWRAEEMASPWLYSAKWAQDGVDLISSYLGSI